MLNYEYKQVAWKFRNGVKTLGGEQVAQAGTGTRQQRKSKYVTIHGSIQEEDRRV